jgi:predicted metal-binding protein
MKVETFKVTSNGKIPISIEIVRSSRDRLLEFQTSDKDRRNGWCNKGGHNCDKYGCRPCCPPKVKLFSELKERKYVYLVMVQLTLEDYLDYSPKTREHKAQQFLFMGAAHKITRNINNKLVNHFEGQVFRVGGCLGCQYPKTGVCKRFAPPLEGTGINVCKVAKAVFKTTIEWADKGRPINKMIAIGAVYTNEEIPTQKFKEVIDNVCMVKNSK